MHRHNLLISCQRGIPMNFQTPPVATLDRMPSVDTTNGSEIVILRTASQRMPKAGIFAVAPVLYLVVILILFPGTGSADTLIAFSNSGPSTGTLSGNTVAGVTFNTIDSTAVNNFIESYSNDVLTFVVSGGGILQPRDFSVMSAAPSLRSTRRLRPSGLIPNRSTSSLQSPVSLLPRHF